MIFGNWILRKFDIKILQICPPHLSDVATLPWKIEVVSGVRRMNEVNARRARLVPGWVTVFGRVYHLGM